MLLMRSGPGIANRLLRSLLPRLSRKHKKHPAHHRRCSPGQGTTRPCSTAARHVGEGLGPFCVLAQRLYEVALEAEIVHDGRVVDIDPCEVALGDIVDDDATNHRMGVEPALGAELARGAPRAYRKRH